MRGRCQSQHNQIQKSGDRVHDEKRGKCASSIGREVEVWLITPIEESICTRLAEEDQLNRLNKPVVYPTLMLEHPLSGVQ
jgi:hypothetical protein